MTLKSLVKLHSLSCLLLVVTFFSVSGALSQKTKTPLDYSNLDHHVLNKHVLDEVNKLRKKAKVDFLENHTSLFEAAQDHAGYMMTTKKVGHKQREKLKKWPNLRLAFYGARFDRVGENVQLNNLNLESTERDRKTPKIKSYEKLAEVLVLAWKNSPEHYANMIHVDFSTTYTAVSIGSDGAVYACQLFAGKEYEDKYAAQNPVVGYMPFSKWRCIRCKNKQTGGSVFITEDSTIIYFAFHKKNTNLRWSNRWRDGIAADIVLKSQFDCEEGNYLNDRIGVTGIPLEPIYRKDFRKNGRWRRNGVWIELGKIPSYIDEPYEVNLTVVNGKTTCKNIMYQNISTGYFLDVPIDYKLDSLSSRQPFRYKTEKSFSFEYPKNEAVLKSSNFEEFKSFVIEHLKDISSLRIVAYSSVEGRVEENEALHAARANQVLDILFRAGYDTSGVSYRVAENLTSFKKDVATTEYANLLALDYEELKERLLDESLQTALEPILKTHRTVEVVIDYYENDEKKYDREMLYSELSSAITDENNAEISRLQKIEYALAWEGEVGLSDVKGVKLPGTKQNLSLLHDRALLCYKIDSLNPERDNSLRRDLERLLEFKEKDKWLNTSLLILDYYQALNAHPKEMKRFFKDAAKDRKFVDKTTRARIVLNISAVHDWKSFRQKFSKSGDFLHDDAKKFIRDARLETDQVFNLASYYTFFEEFKFAYELTNRIVSKTDNPDNLIFFLKLIMLDETDVSRKKHLSYYKRIRDLTGEDFCDLFNSPGINFQVLEDKEIKEIYCEMCN